MRFIVVVAGVWAIVMSLWQEPRQDGKVDAAVAIAKARAEVVKLDVELSEIEMDHASCQYKRYTKLISNRVVSDEDYEIITQRYRNAKAVHDRNKARLKEAQTLIKWAELTGEVDKTLTLAK